MSVFRIIMLVGLTWLMGLTAPLFIIFRMGISWRDIILIGGGLFLIAKATHEIHAEVEGRGDGGAVSCATDAFAWIVVQLVAVDLVFSLDSIITAIGMASPPGSAARCSDRSPPSSWGGMLIGPIILLVVVPALQTMFLGREGNSIPPPETEPQDSAQQVVRY